MVNCMWDCVAEIFHDIFVDHIQLNSAPLWSSDQIFCIHIERSTFDSRSYQIFWEVVGLEWGPLSLMGTTEGLLGRNSSDWGLESREYGRGNPLRWLRNTVYHQMLALTSRNCDGYLGRCSSLADSGHGIFCFVYNYTNHFNCCTQWRAYKLTSLHFVSSHTYVTFRLRLILFANKEYRNQDREHTNMACGVRMAVMRNWGHRIANEMK
jgi:hypothetical protein